MRNPCDKFSRPAAPKVDSYRFKADTPDPLRRSPTKTSKLAPVLVFKEAAMTPALCGPRDSAFVADPLQLARSFCASSWDGAQGPTDRGKVRLGTVTSGKLFCMARASRAVGKHAGHRRPPWFVIQTLDGPVMRKEKHMWGNVASLLIRD